MSRSKTKNKSPRSRTKGFLPSGPIAEAVLARGQKALNIWYCTSRKVGGDVILKSDAEISTAFWMELDPSVLSYRPPCEAQDDGRPAAFRECFRIVQACNVVAYRQVASLDLPSTGIHALKANDKQQQLADEARSIESTFERVGPTELQAQENWVASGKVAMAALTATQHHTLEPEHLRLMTLMGQQPVWEVGALFEQLHREHHPLLLSALFRALGRGEIRADIDRFRFGRFTKIWLPSAEIKTSADTNESSRERAMREFDARLHAARLLRTQNEAAELDRARISQVLMAGGMKWTKSTVPPELRDPNQWPSFDMESVEDKTQRQYKFQVQAAVTAYLCGVPLDQIAKAHGVGRSTLLHYLNRALLLHEDGRIYGWRVLGPCKQLNGYSRTAPVEAPETRSAAGYAGAFVQLLRRYPKIQIALDKAILSSGGSFEEARVSTDSVHQTFLECCAREDIGSYDYPFNSDSKGRRSIQRYVKSVLASEPVYTATLYSGKGAARRLGLENGNSPLIRHTEIFDAVYQDGHKLDALGVILIPHPKGPIKLPLRRFELQLLIEGESKAALGYSVSIRGFSSANDALTAIRHALTPWEPMSLDRPLIRYCEGAGFPSGLIPELQGAVWATHYLDNASIYTSAAVLERMRRRIGCAINLGPVENWARRHVVEGVFSVLERAGFQRLPSTVGSSPVDPRRRFAAEKAVETTLDYQTLLYLIDVAIANYNAIPKPALGMRSPLQILRERAQDPRSNFFPRLLPPLLPNVADMHIEIETLPVRGNTKEGRVPYVEIDEVHYVSPVLSAMHHLIGHQVRVHIDPDDLRFVVAFTEDGQCLGSLKAVSGWDQTKHTRKMRKEINAMKRAGRVSRLPGENWVMAFLRTCTEEAARELHGKKPKVSKAASVIAAVAHAAELPIPEVSEDTLNSASIRPIPVAEVIELPAFLARPKRRIAI